MEEWFDIKMRGIVGGDDGDLKEMVILGRVVRWTKDGLRYEAGPKHRKLVMEKFGFDEESKPAAANGAKADKEEEWELEIKCRRGEGFQGSGCSS